MASITGARNIAVIQTEYIVIPANGGVLRVNTFILSNSIYCGEGEAKTSVALQAQKFKCAKTFSQDVISG